MSLSFTQQTPQNVGFHSSTQPTHFYLTNDYNRFTIALGKLKIPEEAFQPDVNVDIQVVATHSLGIRSVEQTISWQTAIRKPR